MSRSLIFSIATILIVSSIAGGQTATGILQGRVSDDSGAAVPDAKVNHRERAHRGAPGHHEQFCRKISSSPTCCRARIR